MKTLIAFTLLCSVMTACASSDDAACPDGQTCEAPAGKSDGVSASKYLCSAEALTGENSPDVLRKWGRATAATSSDGQTAAMRDACAAYSTAFGSGHAAQVRFVSCTPCKDASCTAFMEPIVRGDGSSVGCFSVR